MGNQAQKDSVVCWGGAGSLFGRDAAGGAGTLRSGSAILRRQRSAPAAAIHARCRCGAPVSHVLQCSRKACWLAPTRAPRWAPSNLVDRQHMLDHGRVKAAVDPPNQAQQPPCKPGVGDVLSQCTGERCRGGGVAGRSCRCEAAGHLMARAWCAAADRASVCPWPASSSVFCFSRVSRVPGLLPPASTTPGSGPEPFLQSFDHAAAAAPAFGGVSATIWVPRVEFVAGGRLPRPTRPSRADFGRWRPPVQ